MRPEKIETNNGSIKKKYYDYSLEKYCMSHKQQALGLYKQETN